MKNIEKYQKLIAKGEVDALLLTSKHNRQYAAEYCIAEGVAVICKTQSYYFTDFRYIESAQKNLPGFAVKMVDTEHPYTKLINEAISDNTVKTIGFEDDTLTVEEYTLYNTKLNAVLHPYAAEINAPRASKEPWEIEYMKKAQEITDRTFDDLLNVIHPGMTEKELCAELIYRLYKYGSEGPSFDPITVSGPNTSLPHGVPSERVLQYGDFVTMDFGCLYHGYCSDMTRTIALGYVSEKMDKVYHTVLEAQLAGIAATKAGVTGKEMELRLDEVHITVNKNAIPNDPEKPFVTSGIRVGTPAVTTRGLTEADMATVAHLIKLTASDFEASAEECRRTVAELCRKYPLYS